jgi:hypothetical protein
VHGSLIRTERLSNDNSLIGFSLAAKKPRNLRGQLLRHCPVCILSENILKDSRHVLALLMPRVCSHRKPIRASEAARQRVWALDAREKESDLFPQEKVELEDFLKLEHLIVLAKAKALAAGHN